MIDIDVLIKDAMLSKNKIAYETYKLLKAKILEFKTAKNAKEYTEAEEAAIIKKMIKERMSTAEIYLQNHRDELAKDEMDQMAVLKTLLPKEPTAEEIMTYLNDTFKDGISKNMMGTVIKNVKNNFAAADGKMVADCVKSIII